MSIIMPAGFGIIGVNIKHETARARVFTTFSGYDCQRPPSDAQGLGILSECD